MSIVEVCRSIAGGAQQYVRTKHNLQLYPEEVGAIYMNARIE